MRHSHAGQRVLVLDVVHIAHFSILVDAAILVNIVDCFR
jgi:hypothetical protein